MAKTKKTTYYLVVESFDRLDSRFEKILKVEAASIEDAVTGYFDGDYFDKDSLTVEGENGRFAGEEHTIGIGVTEEQAALQFIKSRIEME